MPVVPGSREVVLARVAVMLVAHGRRGELRRKGSEPGDPAPWMTRSPGARSPSKGRSRVVRMPPAVPEMADVLPARAATGDPRGRRVPGALRRVPAGGVPIVAQQTVRADPGRVETPRDLRVPDQARGHALVAIVHRLVAGDGRVARVLLAPARRDVGAGRVRLASAVPVASSTHLLP